MKKAIVTGAFGFAGANLVEQLLELGYRVYAVGRAGSAHNARLKESDQLKKIYLDMNEYDRLPELIPEKCDYFYHLAWGGDRNDLKAQAQNVTGAVAAMTAAARMGDNIRFLGIGSQAEYGERGDAALITEDLEPKPFSAYGSSKVSAYMALKTISEENGIDFMWGRIFSLIGKYEPDGRMLPDLVHKLRAGEKVSLSSCEQYWDYLDAKDAAKAMIAICEKGKPGEIYNIANGNFKPLKEFVLEACHEVGADESLISFGEKAQPFVSLRPSVEKIMKDTGWKPETSFVESIMKY